MGFWDKITDNDINNARGTEGGLYLCPGNFTVQILRCKMIETKDKHEAFVAELNVLKSDTDELKADTQPSYYVDMDGKFPQLSLGNVADFIRAALASMAQQHGEECPPLEEIELTKALGESVTGVDNLLAGVYLNCFAFNKKTRAGSDFTRTKWSTPDNLTEILAAAA
jgi:hypothetical protein